MAGASLKAALDLDWDAPGAQQQALRIVLDTLEAVEGWLDTHVGQCQADTREITSLVAAHQVYEQDVTTTSDGTPHPHQGSRKIAASVSEMPRCAMGAKVGVCSLMATTPRTARSEQWLHRCRGSHPPPPPSYPLIFSPLPFPHLRQDKV